MKKKTIISIVVLLVVVFGVFVITKFAGAEGNSGEETLVVSHELGETVIGDLTQFQISRDEKEKIEHQAVHKILSELIDGKQIEELFLEFDAHESKEAQFAYQCDKLECDLQCKLYDEQNCVDLHNQSNNDTIHDKQYHL